MIKQRIMEESSANALNKSRRQKGNTPEEELEIETESKTTEFTMTFKHFSLTPALEGM